MKKTLLKKLLSLTIVITLLAMPLTGCVSTSSSTTATATHECFNTVVTLTINSCSGDESADDIINEFMKIKDFKSGDIVYVCGNLTNENIFFINEFEKFLKALEQSSNRNKYIYDTVCNDLENNFLKFNFCNFKNNKCLSQRHKNVFLNNYPYTNTDGCCFKIIRKCQHNNKDGTCKVKCISCKLFICPYLSKRGIGYYASELLLLRAFYTPKQRGIYVNSFYESEDKILSKLKNDL